MDLIGVWQQINQNLVDMVLLWKHTIRITRLEALADNIGRHTIVTGVVH